MRQIQDFNFHHRLQGVLAIICFLVFSGASFANDKTQTASILQLDEQNSQTVGFEKRNSKQKRFLARAITESCVEALTVLGVQTEILGPSLTRTEKVGMFVRKMLGYDSPRLILPGTETSLNEMAAELASDGIRLIVDPAALVNLRGSAAHVVSSMSGIKSSFVVVGPYHLALALSGQPVSTDRLSVHEKGHAEIATLAINQIASPYFGTIHGMVGQISGRLAPGHAKVLSVDELFVGQLQIRAGLERVQELLRQGLETYATELMNHLGGESFNLFREAEAIRDTADLFINTAAENPRVPFLAFNSYMNRQLKIREGVVTVSGPDPETGTFRLLALKYPLVGVDRIARKDLKPLLIEKWKIARDVAERTRKSLVLFNYEMDVLGDRFPSLDLEGKQAGVAEILLDFNDLNFAGARLDDSPQAKF